MRWTLAAVIDCIVLVGCRDIPTAARFHITDVAALDDEVSVAEDVGDPVDADSAGTVDVPGGDTDGVSDTDVSKSDAADACTPHCDGKTCDNGCGGFCTGTCSDGNLCTISDSCQDGACVAGKPADCNDGNACTHDACGPSSGCNHSFTTDPCDDGNACTTPDACSLGACVGTQVLASVLCADGNACTSDTCDTTSGCSHANNTASCSDGNACTVYDQCIAGACQPGASKSCDDGNPCTTDTCAPESGCVHTGLAAGATCGSGICTASGQCAVPPSGMVLVPGGTFWMGCNATKDAVCNANEKPQHKVTLSAYYMDLTETTVAQYKACVDAGVCTVPSTGSYVTYPSKPNNPVNYVDWTQSQAYCKWRGSAFDLPTEAQWEMAARGSCEKNGSTAGDAGCAAAMRTYPWGEIAPTASYAVFGTSSTAAVGSIPAGDSPYGLHDMAGNVWEWNRDWYSATYYSSSPATDPYASVSASYRVSRGGSFVDLASYLSAGLRSSLSPSAANYTRGLRCMRSYP